MGGDIYCEKNGYRWVIQSKWKKTGSIGPKVVDEALQARSAYDAHKVIVVTNGSFSSKTVEKTTDLSQQGVDIELWDGENLDKYARESPQVLPAICLRPYQQQALEAIKKDLRVGGRSLLYLATGLGKTVVAGSVIRQIYEDNHEAKILVLAHTDELIEQLQRSLWPDIPFDVPTQLINRSNRPPNLEGVTISTNLSILNYIEEGYEPDFLIVDECHRVGNSNTYGNVIRVLANVPRLGVTATPWRGDGYELETVFGTSSYSCGIEEGMRQGYLAPVDYKLYSDNINWNEIPMLSENAYTIAQLNSKLFIPQRDEIVLDSLSEHWQKVVNPKCIIFCQSIEHAERIHSLLIRYDRWQTAELMHSGLNKNDRKFALLRFRSDDCNVLVARDILNEGIDVPNVNIVCFARVTHSRRIFVQQLGRGLRLAPDKDKVIVLDFAADTRRLAAVEGLRNSVMGAHEIEELPNVGNSIEFMDQRSQKLIKEWIKDAADLETRNKESTLQFPVL